MITSNLFKKSAREWAQVEPDWDNAIFRLDLVKAKKRVRINDLAVKDGFFVNKCFSEA